ncbi:flavoprotein [Nocardia sp. NBC_00508]|uniref:flavoprotein n=1 Tax=Nocardia sp. NBC_00508 TaxID=2975992 RepID=UPI002E8067D3|nr:flavoprotein [Nocardia sp. NBC_00508]WUD65460.1 flavoprotein [Nocardia sp. NBC_00508]
MDANGNPVLYALVTGSPAARDVGKLVAMAQADGWVVCVIASPSGTKFIDVEAIAAQTGYPVRSEYKEPGTPDVLPPPDGMIAAPVTGNSVAKWAAGISDTLPLGLLVEGLGKGLPIVAVPYSNRAQMSFPAIQDGLRKLSEWGVTVLMGDGEPHEPRSGESLIPRFPWDTAWQALLAHPRRTNVDRPASN